MDVATVEQFLELLEKGDLLTPEQLAEARLSAQQTSDPQALARTLTKQGLLTRWQAAQLLAGRSSFLLGKYKLLDLLGRGGMGSVFLGIHTTMNRRVALKIVSRELGRDPAARERFLAEARTIAALDHPNIVQAYSVDNEGDRYYIVMEYVDGRDLRRIVEEDGPLAYDLAADAIRQAADGLAHAHSRNMIHCDIKPSNLLVNQQGVVKILDMGLARLTGPNEAASAGQDERVLGTVDYMSPEQALESAAFDHRADIYSLGCSLYFLLTGHPPFPEGTLAQRIVKHQTQEPQSITDQRPDAPRELVSICRKMMAKNPDDRLQSAGEVSRALVEWTQEEDRLKRALPLEDFKVVEEPEEAPPPAAERAAEAAAAAAAAASKVRHDELMAAGNRRRTIAIAGLGAFAVAALVGLIAFLSGHSEKADTEGETPSVAQGPESTGAQSAQPEEDQPRPDSRTRGRPREELQPPQPPAAEPPEQGKPSEKPRPEPPVVKEPSTAPEEQPPEKPEQKPTPPRPKKRATRPDTPKGKVDSGKPEREPGREPPQRVDPFRDFVDVIDLPLLEAKGSSAAASVAPAALAEIHAAPNANWNLALLGGLDASKGTRKFVLERKDSEPDKPSWLVYMELPAAGEEKEKQSRRIDAAKIWPGDDKLTFQWLGSAEAGWANYLRNCALEIRVDNQTRTLRLAKPFQLDPIAIDFDRGIARSTFPLPWLPNASSTRLEVLGLTGYKDYVLEPPGPAPPDTPINLNLMRGGRDGQKVVSLEVGYRVTATGLHLQLKLVSPTAEQFRRLQVAGFKAKTEEARKRVTRELNKNLPAETRSQLLANLDTIDAQLWCEKFSAAKSTTKLHFRLLAGDGSQRMELAATKELPITKAPTARKSGGGRRSAEERKRAEK